MTQEPNDRDLDRLLSFVSSPDNSVAGMDNLLARINAPAISKQKSMHWLSLLPLAASLVVGIYLGTAGVDFLGNDDDQLSSGLISGSETEDVEAYAEEDLT